jgi:quercetin dioxygenase-like cupin family protein
VIDEILFIMENTMVRRLVLAPGETVPWHRAHFIG